MITIITTSCAANDASFALPSATILAVAAHFGNLMIPTEWLRRKATPEEFEQEQIARAATTFNLPLDKVAAKLAARPFGFLTDRWRGFVARLEPADELWFFSTPDETFAKKLGCQGYAIVRDGVVRDTLTTLET